MNNPKTHHESEYERHFGAITYDDTNVLGTTRNNSNGKFYNKLKVLRSDIVGSYTKIQTPFGTKPLCYVDWTASGRAVNSIEKFLFKHVNQLYGNTHTTTSITGHQSTCFRHEARQIIAQSVNAKITGRAAEDVVIFTGNGTTDSIQKIIASLNLNIPLTVKDEINTPVVFVSSYEHHSNLLPWRESIAEVVTIEYHPITGVDLSDLNDKLTQYSTRKLKIGAFSAASNITGILTDVDAVSILIHKAGGIVIFDYATAAPYVKMDMNPVLISEDSAYAYKDAIVFSGHKFLGGPGSPGILVIKKKLLSPYDTPPTAPGGGTVFYVTEEHHRYLSNREEREESGTANLLGDIKIGLAMHLKQSLGVSEIQEREQYLSHYIQEQLEKDPRILLLGRIPIHNSTLQAYTTTTTTEENKHDSNMMMMTSSSSWNSDLSTPVHPITSSSSNQYTDKRGHHLPIFSFLIKYKDKVLHHNYVCALLNDLFGIQSRGGCMCAGPFSQSILGISTHMNQRLEQALLDKHEVLRPGYSRISVPVWMLEEEVKYIIDSIHFIAEHGWKFLPLYRYNHKTGEWAHTTRLTKFPERIWLSNINFFPATLSVSSSSSFSSSSDGHSAQNVEKFADKTLAADSSLNSMDDIYNTSTLDSILSDSWKLSNLTDLFTQINTDTQCVLTNLSNNKSYKQESSNSSNNSINSSGQVVDSNVTCVEELRWFTIASDIQTNSQTDPVPSPVVTSIKDILDPSKFIKENIHKLNQISVTTNANIQKSTDITTYMSTDSVLNTNMTVTSSQYAQKREKKLPSFSKNHSTLDSQSKRPRYSQDSFLDTLKTNANHTTTAATTTSVSGRSTTNQVSIQSSINSNDMNITKDTIQSTVTKPIVAVAAAHSNISTTIDPTVQYNGRGSTYIPPPVDNPRIYTSKHILPPKKIMKLVGQALIEWNMIQEGDKLLLGLSGGKDSLALLHILLAFQKRAPINFTISCATVDPQTDSFDPKPLIPYIQSLGLTYHYLSEPIIDMAKNKLQGDSLCAFCSRFKRGLLYSCCRTFNYNKLVLAQHLDDLAESFIMSALHNGQIRTMKANYKIEAGDVHVIRPLIYVRESMTRDFSQSSRLPIINENCPACFEEPKERHRVKKLLQQEESMVPALFSNLRKAFLPLLHEDTYMTMMNIVKQIESKSSSNNNHHHNSNTNSNGSSNNNGSSNGNTSSNGERMISSKRKLHVNTTNIPVPVQSSTSVTCNDIIVDSSITLSQNNEKLDNNNDGSVSEVITNNIHIHGIVSVTEDMKIHVGMNSMIDIQQCDINGYCAPCYELI